MKLCKVWWPMLFGMLPSACMRVSPPHHSDVICCTICDNAAGQFRHNSEPSDPSHSAQEHFWWNPWIARPKLYSAGFCTGALHNSVDMVLLAHFLKCVYSETGCSFDMEILVSESRKGMTKARYHSSAGTSNSFLSPVRLDYRWW